MAHKGRSHLHGDMFGLQYVSETPPWPRKRSNNSLRGRETWKVEEKTEHLHDKSAARRPQPSAHSTSRRTCICTPSDTSVVSWRSGGSTLSWTWQNDMSSDLRDSKPLHSVNVSAFAGKRVGSRAQSVWEKRLVLPADPGTADIRACSTQAITSGHRSLFSHRACGLPLLRPTCVGGELQRMEFWTDPHHRADPPVGLARLHCPVQRQQFLQRVVRSGY